VVQKLGLACPKNEEDQTGADAQTDANKTDRQDRQKQTQQADAIRTVRRRQKSDKMTTLGQDGQPKTQSK
jgi:hypothetical protein